ncbi:MAG: hypothetical protein P4N59_20000 [Negativicutes bacterium]|nr:hypothetical protein [Negativicutes bacterium]
MDNLSLTEMLLTPLTPFFGVVVVLLGIYSITFNAADAKSRNHTRAKRTALIGGWVHIFGGLVILLYRLIA